MKDSNAAEEKYACSTSKITLNDFEYFSSDLTYGETPVDSVITFSGGFNPYGFFEDQTQIDRTPAGENSNDQSGQILKAGMFSVIY